MANFKIVENGECKYKGISIWQETTYERSEPDRKVTSLGLENRHGHSASLGAAIDMGVWTDDDSPISRSDMAVINEIYDMAVAQDLW